MNSDNSQQPLDNWVQKRVRNLEGMNRARHVSADQGDAEKPNKNYLSSKRSSVPGPLSRRTSLPRSTAREKQTGLRPSVTPKSRSISPISLHSSQIPVTVKITKTETVKPEPPVRKSSLTSPNRLVSTRLLQFQPGLSEPEITIKPCSPSKKVSLDSSEDMNGTLPVKKVPSPTDSTSNSPKRSPDGRPPRPSSGKPTNGLSGKSSVSKVTGSKVASSSHHSSKPSIKPKPASVSVATDSKTKADLRVPNSAQTTECKSPVHSSLRQPGGRITKTTKSKSPVPKIPVPKIPVPKLPHSVSVTTTASTAEAKGVKSEDKSTRPKHPLQDNARKMDSHRVSQFKKPFDSSKSLDSSKTLDASKLHGNRSYGSPKASRRQFGSAKSSTMKSALRTPSRTSSVPVPKKPKPPPILAPKPAQNEVSKKIKGTSESSTPLQRSVSADSTVTTGKQKEPDSLSVNINSKPNQETLPSTETATVTETTLESKEKVTTLNTLAKSEAIDEDIYDDVVHLPNTTNAISSENLTEHDALLSSGEVNVEATGNIGDDTVHPVDVDIPAKSTTEDDSLSNNDLTEIQGDASSNDTGIKIPSELNEGKKDVPEQSRGETNSVPLMEQSPVSLVMVKQQTEEHTAMHTDDEIYDDVVVQNTVRVSVQEKVVVDTSGDDQSVVTSATVTMETAISINKQSLSADIPSIPAKSEPCDEIGDGSIEGQASKTQSPPQQAQLTESEALYDDIVHPEELPQKKQARLSNDDFQVAELCVSPRQSRVASFQRAGDKNFGYRDSGLGIEAYYDKIDRSDDVIAEPAFYDHIGEGREQLETVSSTEDVLQSESSTENVIVVTDIEAPPLPPRSEDLIKEINENKKDINKSKSTLTGTLLEVSTKVVEMTTVESGFEDQCFDGEAPKDMPTRITSKAKPDPLVITKPCDNSPPPLPPRRPQSTQLDDVPLRSPGFLSQRASSGSPPLPLLPQRKISAPQLPSSPRDFLSSSSSLAPSHSAVSIISGRSEDRYPTDAGSDVSSLVDVGGECTATEHKKEKSKFSLGIFGRKKSEKKKKTDNVEDSDHARPRASSMGQSLHRKKSSRHAVKKKGSVPPEMQFLPTDADYSLPDPIYFAGDKNYDDCTVIKNNWKSPPPDSNRLSSNFSTDAIPSMVSSNDVGPELSEIQGTEHSELNKNKQMQKSVESLGPFTQNFEDSSGWFDDIYDMVANSTTFTETLEVKLTVTAENNDDIYDTVAPDLLPDTGKLVVADSPNLNTKSSSVDSSGSFDSFEEDEDDHLSPLNSEFSDTLKGHSLPQRSIQTKVASPTRPRSCSNVNQTEIVKSLQITKSLRPAEDIEEDVMETTLVYADAVWDYDPTQDGDLKFHANDVIEVTDMTDDDWWLGYVNNSTGWFPASYVRIRVGQEEEEVEHNDGNKDAVVPQLQRIDSNEGSVASGRSFRRTVRRASSEGILDKKLSRSEYRAKIVEEIVSTERTYVKYLEDVVEGYMQRCIAYPRLFTPDRIEVIFGNMVDLLKFQKTFLLKLETCVTPADLSQSQIGTVFIDHETEFNVYSEYCNNHPYAVNEMNELQEDPQYMLFFESCRLLRNLGDLPLEAFLLKPVQKICKYPLQLSELLKYTDTSHPDYVFVKDAVESMKNVASLINSRKRRIENLYKLALWQKAIDNWKGDHVVETSSEEIFSGDLQKISKGHSQERHFTLFDHQLVYCKREAISHRLQYRGRIIMDNCKIIDLSDGEEIYGGNPVKNAWKINNETKNKWYVLYSKDPSIKEAWMDAFNRERQHVQDDAISKFNIPSRLRKMAIVQADKSTKKEIKAKRTVLQESIDIKQRGAGFQGSPNIPKKKGSKKKKTRRSAV